MKEPWLRGLAKFITEQKLSIIYWGLLEFHGYMLNTLIKIRTRSGVYPQEGFKMISGVSYTIFYVGNKENYPRMISVHVLSLSLSNMNYFSHSNTLDLVSLL